MTLRLNHNNTINENNNDNVRVLDQDKNTKLNLTSNKHNIKMTTEEELESFRSYDNEINNNKRDKKLRYFDGISRL